MAKKRKETIVEYVLTTKGYNKVVAGKNDHEVGVHPSQRQINNLDTAKTQFLRTNPFMYNSKTSAYPITSIEEYLVKVRKSEFALGDIVRNPDLSKTKKRRLVKRAFKNWNKDYNTQKSRAFSDSDKTMEVIGGVNFMKISFATKLVMMVLFLLMIFIVSLNSYLWMKIAQTNFGFRLRQNVMDLFNTTAWLKMLANLTIYVLVMFMFYATIYSMVSKDFVRNHKMAINYLKKSEKAISRAYKKKFKKAKTYYLKMIGSKKRSHPPLDIKKVEEGQINITTFDNIRKVTVDRAYTLKKHRPLYVGLKNIFLLLSFGGSLTVVGYALYKIVVSLF
ncbi:MAG TPA: hypothetical protein PLO88_01675 [Bacilli bacterium]|nr:MAG: hypothetical protein BWY97_00334 [Tenericutes bacterium ADurb.BinA124]HNZ50403.1 hypothetical protein [Bacilli bacterium]HPN60826.1 hypothetical protein [Bacilli bacterium]HPX83809.1 hypothetical protein [Bacilli bacterium]HQC74252.1 hypothetical protein [Bacilli bacterium]